MPVAGASVCPIAIVEGSLGTSRQARPAALLMLLPVIAQHTDFAPKDVAKLTCVSKEAKGVIEREGVWRCVRLVSPDIDVADFQRYVLLKQRGVVFVEDVTVWYDVLWDARPAGVPDGELPAEEEEPPYSFGEYPLPVSDVLKHFPDAVIGARSVRLNYYDEDMVPGYCDPITARVVSFIDRGLAQLSVRRFALRCAGTILPGESEPRLLRWTVGSPPTTVRRQTVVDGIY